MTRLSKVCLVVDHLEDNPSKVTQLIGFQPTATVSSKLCSLPVQANWLFDFHKADANLEEQLLELVRFLETQAEGIRSVTARYPTWIQVDVDDRDWIWPYDPKGWRSGEFQLLPEIVKFASQLGLGFKIYFTTGIKGVPVVEAEL